MARRGTALLAMAASALAGWQLLRGLAPPGTSVSAAQAVDRGVAAAVLAVGAAVAAWYLLTAAAVLVAVTLRRFGAAPRALDRAISRFGAPLLRRAAMFTAATSLTLGAPAWAGPPVEPPGAGAVEVDAGSAPWEAGRNASVLIDLGWAPSPAQPFARTHPAAAAPPREAPPPAPAPPPAASNASTASTTPAASTAPAVSTASTPAAPYTVQPGDSLWTIAARELPGATDRQIAARWPEWYAANRATIGPDPHLIHPGMRLHPPAQEAP